MNHTTRVLITGGSSGLGREMARQLGERGWRVAITGRREDRLEETAAAVRRAGGQCLSLVGSVTDMDDVRAHYAKVRAAWGGLDWAVLNAGVGDSMNARKFLAEHFHWTFATNIGGVVNWMECVLPDMIAQGSGVIAGISSLAAFRGLPNSGAYSASKAALLSLLESARVDLRGTGVDVVTVCPGFVKSEMTARNRPSDMLFLMEAPDGVRAILRGIDRRRRIVHFPRRLSLFVKYVLGNMPGFLYDRLVSRIVTREKKPTRDAVDSAG